MSPECPTHAAALRPYATSIAGTGGICHTPNVAAPIVTSAITRLASLDPAGEPAAVEAFASATNAVNEASVAATIITCCVRCDPIHAMRTRLETIAPAMAPSVFAP